MKLYNTVKTGITLKRTVKNVQRFRTIISVLGRHGFDEILIRMNLNRFIPKRRREEGTEQLSLGERLRLSFEELGPTFVKLGQILSTRGDMLPDDVIFELKKLQDNVAPFPFVEVKRLFEEELRAPVDSKFSYFSEVPIASASIGQVHEARLITGEKVVVKVQRPGIEKTINQDIAVLKFLASLLERYIPEIRPIDPIGIIEEFHKTLLHELNYAFEANNTSRFQKNFAKDKFIVIPKIFTEFTTSKILVMEKVEGIRLNDTKAILDSGVDKKIIAREGAFAFFKMVMEDGFFHGDLHPGNFFIIPPQDTINPDTNEIIKGNVKLALIDFGIVGKLNQKMIDRFSNIIVYLVKEDYEKLAFEYADIGAIDASIDFDKLVNDIRFVASPYLGLPLKEINVGLILMNSMRVAVKYDIRIPPEWTTLIRALVAVEGLGKSLDKEFDIMSIADEVISRLTKIKFNPENMLQEFLWIARDYKSFFEVLPRNLRWMLKKFARDGYVLQHQIDGLDELIEKIDNSSKLNAHAIITAGLFIAGAFAMQSQNAVRVLGLPMGSSILFLFAGIMFFFLIIKLFK